MYCVHRLHFRLIMQRWQKRESKTIGLLLVSNAMVRATGVIGVVHTQDRLWKMQRDLHVAIFFGKLIHINSSIWICVFVAHYIHSPTVL